MGHFQWTGETTRSFKTRLRRAGACILAAAAALSLTGCAAGGGSSSAAGSSGDSAEIFAMDTVMDLTAYGKNGPAALSASEEKINALEALLSRTKKTSEVSRLNSAGGAATAVDSEVFSLISRAKALGQDTDGAFDITVAPVVSAWGFTTDSYQVPSQSELDELLTRVGLDNIALGADGSITLKNGAAIDLGGIAKGYASDCVANIFAEKGVKSGKISLGGNVYVCGSKQDGSAWRVAVQDPNNSESYVGVLSLSDAFAVTSGGYQRYFEKNGKKYHHIIDPSTGYPAESGLISVTVVADADADAEIGPGTVCDAFSTALFVMGADRAVDFWRSNGAKYGFGLVLVTDSKKVLITHDIAGKFEEQEGSGYRYEVVS